jgi:hypothetical protein
LNQKLSQSSEANIPHASVAPEDEEPSPLLVSCCKYRSS